VCGSGWRGIGMVKVFVGRNGDRQENLHEIR